MISNLLSNGPIFNRHRLVRLLGQRRSQPIRAGIVGTGYIADFHAHAIRQLEGVELVSVCDASLGSARSFAARWGVEGAFDSVESMLQHQRLDCIHVLVPPTGTTHWPGPFFNRECTYLLRNRSRNAVAI
jgi:ornithine cyclodeaminase/alanine dehydrogenase-like protein (mu-crystallin family)